MPENSDAKKEENSQSSENIEIPPIPKQTAGAIAGAAAGSIAGPIGAVVGGVVGAVAGKAAEKRRPTAPAARRTVRSVHRLFGRCTPFSSHTYQGTMRPGRALRAGAQSEREKLLH